MNVLATRKLRTALACIFLPQGFRAKQPTMVGPGTLALRETASCRNCCSSGSNFPSCWAEFSKMHWTVHTFGSTVGWLQFPSILAHPLLDWRDNCVGLERPVDKGFP